MTQTSATPENLDSVMRRIAKLLAIAGDDRANPEEASAAAGMAERIMRKYQIEHADVIMEQLKKGDDMHAETCPLGKRVESKKDFTVVPPWAQWIAVQVAKVNGAGCKIVLSPTGAKVIQFYGFKQDVMVAKYMFDYLASTVLRLFMEFKKTGADRHASDSYRKGVATGIYSNLMRQQKEKDQELRTSTTGTALVVAKASAVAEYGGEFKTKKSSTTTRNGDAFGAGVKDGRAVDVNRKGVSHSAGSSALRLN